MLSSIGRASVRRVVARGPQSTRALQSIPQFQRADNLQNTNNTSTRSQFSISLTRSYATASKVAAKPKANPKPKTKAAAKQVVKKTSVKRAIKKVAKPAKKKVVAKKPVKKPAKKLQSEGTRARRADAKRAAKLRALKATALKPPGLKPATAWLVISSEAVKANSGTKVTVSSSAASSKYKSLSTAELESYNRIAAQNRADNKMTLKKWIESHTPDEIRLANNARRRLRTIAAKSKTKMKKPFRLEDERQPKRSVHARGIFVGDRFASGDFKGISITDASKLIAKEWNALPSAERQVYEGRARADTERYVDEFKSTFGRVPTFLQGPQGTILRTSFVLSSRNSN